VNDTQNVTLSEEFEWSRARTRAAILVAEGAMTNLEIAKAVHVHSRTLDNWKAHPVFRQRVAELRQKSAQFTEKRFRASVNAKKLRRLQELDEHWRKLWKIAEERGKSLEMQNVPGGTTGLIVRKLKKIGRGRAARVVEEYHFDAALSKALRKVVEEMAKEMRHLEAGSKVHVDSAFKQRRLEILGTCSAALEEARIYQEQDLSPGAGRSQSVTPWPCPSPAPAAGPSLPASLVGRLAASPETNDAMRNGHAVAV
jgi:hypothetical protein